MTAGVPRATPAKAFRGHDGAARRSVFGDRLRRVFRTRRAETARAGGQRRRDETLIRADRGDAHLRSRHVRGPRDLPAACIAFDNWCRRSAKRACAAAGLQVTTNQRASSGASTVSSIALQRRLMRLRTTALPTLRVTMTPTFGAPADLAGGEKACTVKTGADAEAPRRMVVANSRRPRRLTYGRIAAVTVNQE